MRGFPSIRRIVAICALGLGLLPWTRVAADDRGQQIPFRGTVMAQFTFLPTLNPEVFIVDYVGMGQATHLGRFMVHAQYEVTLDYVLDFLTEEEEVEGVNFVFTAANGDQLVGDYDATTNPAGPGQVNFEAHATFTGGTGRFEDATGSYVTRGLVVVDLSTLRGVSHSTIEGTVSSPGARRRR